MNFGLNYKLHIIFLSVTSLILLFQNLIDGDSEHPEVLKFAWRKASAALSQMLPILVWTENVLHTDGDS